MDGWTEVGKRSRERTVLYSLAYKKFHTTPCIMWCQYANGCKKFYSFWLCPRSVQVIIQDYEFYMFVKKVTSPIYRTRSFMERAPPKALLMLIALANTEFWHSHIIAMQASPLFHPLLFPNSIFISQIWTSYPRQSSAWWCGKNRCLEFYFSLTNTCSFLASISNVKCVPISQILC